MSIEKRMILAVVVSAAVIIVWNLLFMPQQEERPVQKAVEENGEEAAEAEAEGGGEATEGAEGVELMPALPQDPIVAKGRREVEVDSPLYLVRLTNESGGSATSWVLKNYEASFGKGPLDLVAPAEYLPEHEGQPLVPLATMLRSGGEYRWLGGLPELEAVTDGDKVLFNDAGEAKVSFRYYEKGVGFIVKELTFHRDSYLVDVTFETNIDMGKALIILGPGVGELLKPAGDGLEPGQERNGYILRKAGTPVQREMAPVTVKAAGEAGTPFKESEIGEVLSWVGVENSFFMALAFGDLENKFFPIYKLTGAKKVPGGKGQTTFYYPFIGFSPREDKAAFRLFVGPKDLTLLETVAGGELTDVVQFGWFAFVSRPALWLLKQLHGFLGNYGLSIILLTVLINVLLLPLILKQRKSMAAMQILQPQIKQIQAKYKAEKGDSIQARQEKKKKLNEETMALYKTEGVNPMGGCLPLLIQLPILIALFDMFRVAIELRKAPFFLWIDNLAAPDPYYITPILMGIVMFASQKVTPTPAADSGGAAMKMLPFIFVFFFAGAASGLVLYWLTSSLFSFGTQLAMNAASPPPAKPPARGGPSHKSGKKKKKSRGK